MLIGSLLGLLSIDFPDTLGNCYFMDCGANRLYEHRLESAVPLDANTNLRASTAS